MNLPQEIEVWYIIPAIRRELAKAMLKKGMSQRDVARKLGVTDAAVSQYLRSKRASEVRFDSATRKEICKSAERLIRNGNAMEELQCMVRFCRNKGLVCSIGKRLGNAPRQCRICFGRAPHG